MPEHYVGFDFGMKRIGTAIGQLATRTASPLQTISAQGGKPDWTHLDTQIQRWQPKALIVGTPLNMDGTEQHLTHCARKFARRLRDRYNLPVHEIDERLTTREARQQIFEAQGYKGFDKHEVDCIAAQLILASWLEQN